MYVFDILSLKSIKKVWKVECFYIMLFYNVVKSLKSFKVGNFEVVCFWGLDG